MKRYIFLVAGLFGLLALCMAADDNDTGQRGYFGRSGSIQGQINNYYGGSALPAYYYSESTNGTGIYFWADNDGGMRTHNSAPTSDTDGVKIVDANDTDVLPWTALSNTAIVDVNSISADLNSLAGSSYYIIDSSSVAIDPNIYDGTTVGERIRVVCKTAGNNIDLTVEHHVTSDPEVIRLDAAKEAVELTWDGTDWVESDVVGTVSYP